MSKIEDYQRAAKVALNVNLSADRAMGVDSPQNDKHRITCEVTGIAPGQWNDALLRFHASYGYYGSSSGYSVLTPEVSQYIALAIQQMGGSIMRTAVELAVKDAEMARLAALDEARQVLKEATE